jgi:peptidoglycan/xylan/chitin deacetylase (PgdA/CDA1 family)
MSGRLAERSRRSSRRWAVTVLAIVGLLASACAAHVQPAPSGSAPAAQATASPAASGASAGPAGTGAAQVSPTATPAASSGTPSPSPAPASVQPTSLPAIPAGSVPILYYHRVQAPPAGYASWSNARKAAFIDYDAIPSAFAAQLDWLFVNGYTTILPRDLAAHWDHGTPLPAKPVILTFDDGWHDWVSTVLPMLQARGMVAEFYVTLAAIADGNITWSEVRTLARAGEGIGAHDIHHVQLAELGAGRPDASPATMWAEINGARQTIGQHIGVYPDSMAYVGGGFSPELETLAKQAGYTTARSIRRGIVQGVALRYQLFVVRVGPFDDVTNVVTGAIDPSLPIFVARMHGVSDRPAK